MIYVSTGGHNVPREGERPHAELEAPARRLPRQGQLRRRQRHARPATQRTGKLIDLLAYIA